MKRYLWVLPTAVLALAVAPTNVTLYGSLQSELGWPRQLTTHWSSNR